MLFVSVDDVRFRCERPSRYAGWLISPGVIVPARCGAPNKCAYCAYMVTVENALVVALDAQQQGPPTLGVTLTTVNPQHRLDDFRRDVEKVVKAVRRREPDAEYLGFIEWTTGKAEKSGGHRRLHQHLLVRGVAGAAEDVEQVIREVWHRRTGADRVEARELRTAAGATAYLVHHHRKREQAPPRGFTGKRLRPSRGYFAQPVAELREQARAIAREKRVRRVARRLVDWEALDGAPDELCDAELQAALAEARDAAARVQFVKLDRDGGILGATPVDGRKRPAGRLRAVA